MEISKIKIPGRQTPIDVKDAQAREDLQDVIDFISDKEYAVAQMLAELYQIVEDLINFVSEKEQGAAAAIADLNNRINNISE